MAQFNNRASGRQKRSVNSKFHVLINFHREVFIRSLVAASLVFAAPFVATQVANAQQKENKVIPATNSDVATYRMMSAVTFCEARAREIDFEKSVAIALAGQHNALYVKHGGKAVGVDKKIPEQQFFSNAGFFLVGAALSFCPKSVPAQQKKEFEKAAASLKLPKK